MKLGGICVEVASLLGVALLHCVALLALAVSAGAAEPEAKLLFGADNGFRFGELQAPGVELTVEQRQLRVHVPAGDQRGAPHAVLFPLQNDERNLASFAKVEVEITNIGSTPLVFTFWALSGPGWGGVSTFSTTQNDSGRETLAPGERKRFEVDLHALYSGREVYTKAIDPAAVRCLELVFEPARVPATMAVGEIRAVGRGPDPPHDISGRVRVPEVERTPPAPGRRVYQKLPGWEATEVEHVLTLPRNWSPGRRWPVIVEYTGNVFYHKFCHSTGRTDQGNLAYGLARGGDFICLNLPFISEDGRHEQVDGWGDITKTADYCLSALEFVEKNYGAEPRAVFYTGFSRGSYAANYLALRDDRIAAVWTGFLTLRDPGAEWREKVRGWRGANVGWNERAARMNGRPWFHQDDELGREVHTDVEFLEDRPSTVATRRWLREQVARVTQPAEPAHAEPQIDASFPGGNIVVEKIEGDHVFVHQDLRDTKGDWFYWCFRVRGAQGRELTFHFTKSRAIGLLGPGVSRDDGRVWRWLGKRDSFDSFKYKFGADEGDVRFSFGMPYQHADLARFLEKHAGNPHLKTEDLGRTKKGTMVELLRVGRVSGNPEFKVLVTVRHHACEMMASYVMEGMIEEFFADSETGLWLREHVQAAVIPMVDKDGVEAGDQGKNRIPHDHKADYRGQSIYPEVAALRAFVANWAGGKPHVTFDLHNPALSSRAIYTHALRSQGKGGTDESGDASSQTSAIRFLQTLEKVQQGPLPFRVQDSIDFAARKGTPVPEAIGRPETANAAPVTASSGARITIGFEIPYAVAGGAEVNPDSARSLGRDIARALAQYLKVP